MFIIYGRGEASITENFVKIIGPPHKNFEKKK